MSPAQTFPTLTKSPWYDREGLTALLSAGPPLLAQVFAFLTWKPDPLRPDDATARHVVVAGFIWLVLATVAQVVKAWRKDQLADNVNSPEHLMGCLYMLHAGALLQRGYDPANDEHRVRLRTTLHKVEKTKGRAEEEEMLQILPYVGGLGEGSSEEKKKVGRFRSARCGVVGKAFTSNDSALFAREDATKDFNAYKAEMRANWMMTEKDANGLDSSRFSHMALPIGNKAKTEVVAVLFLDSSDVDFFSKEVQEFIGHQAFVLAKYVETAYR